MFCKSPSLRGFASVLRRAYSHNLASKVKVYTEFAEECWAAQHIVVCPKTNHGVIIDSVLDYNQNQERISTVSADRLLEIIETHDIKIDYILETHVHADHLTAASYLKSQLAHGDIKPKIGISKDVTIVQKTFSQAYNVDIVPDGSQFDHLFDHDEEFAFGATKMVALATPGHTPCCVSFLIPHDAIFVGDTMFYPDTGTGRCDFPGGSATALWNSLQKILSVGDEVRMFLAHDYLNSKRDSYVWETTVGAQRHNVHLQNNNKDEYIKLRTTRDRTLNNPKLIHASLQVNLFAGDPPTDNSGKFFVKYPHITWRHAK